MASTEQLPSGRWRPIARDGAGRKIGGLGTFARKRDAAEAARNAETDARRRAQATKGTLSATTSWGDWWDILAPKRTFNSDTAVADESIARIHARPRWGEAPLNAITRDEIQTWVDGLFRSGLSAGYTTRIYRLLQASMTAAVANGTLSASPCTQIALPVRRRKLETYCSAGDIAALTAEMESPWSDLFRVAFETGLRPGELAGLHVNRVDLERGWLAVVEVYVQRARKIRHYPKDGDMRYVPLTTVALDLLRPYVADRPKEPCGVEHYKGTCNSPLVFVCDSGVCTQPKQDYRLRGTSARLGLEAKSPYTARRGYATRLNDAGVPAFTIGDSMGHSGLELTRGYVQPTPAARDQILAALGEPSKLRAVGQNPSRGTRRGTDSSDQTPRDAAIDSHRKQG